MFRRNLIFTITFMSSSPLIFGIVNFSRRPIVYKLRCSDMFTNILLNIAILQTTIDAHHLAKHNLRDNDIHEEKLPRLLQIINHVDCTSFLISRLSLFWIQESIISSFSFLSNFFPSVKFGLCLVCFMGQNSHINLLDAIWLLKNFFSGERSNCMT